MQNYIITDAMNPAFQRAFKMYFEEQGLSIRDWSSLFQEMNEDPGTKILMEMAEHNLVIGFIMVKIDALSNWFFEEKIGLSENSGLILRSGIKDMEKPCCNGQRYILQKMKS